MNSGRGSKYLDTVPSSNRSYFFTAPPSSKYPDGDHHVNPRDLNESLKILAASLNFTVGRKANGLVFHSLRHYFETQCVNASVPQFVVDRWMGHAGQRSMGKVYYGLTDPKSQEFMSQVKF
jgi:integrase